MPAAAVIPAPIAYIKVVAVKKLVVGFRDGPGPGRIGDRKVMSLVAAVLPRAKTGVCSSGLSVLQDSNADVYFEKIRVFKAGRRLNT